MVRKDGGKGKQDSVATTKTFGCKQRLRRGERSPTQPENSYGGARRKQRAYAGRVLRTVQRNEGVHEHRYRCHRISVRLPGYQTATVKFFITQNGVMKNSF